ncbi:hypothetical protein B0H16DRAFT_1732351 [Mycena metata]|uniref:Uncharacterized protein n=1 Tax=Mycena metata TaxID=1033252 RepID=A0AAD7MU93_9AGAR|nr:hypothetical protein B0H16DRAFT_1732351 [Mycena metata]
MDSELTPFTVHFATTGPIPATDVDEEMAEAFANFDAPEVELSVVPFGLPHPVPYVPDLTSWSDNIFPGAMDDVPPELWADILHEVCDEELDEDKTFLSYRDSVHFVSQAHPRFAAVVNDAGSFWKHMLITCSTTPQSISDHVAKSKKCLLDVNIMLDLEELDDFTPGALVPVHSDRLDFHLRRIIECLHIVVASVPRWRRVCIWCATDILLLAVLSVLGGVAAPSIEYLLFTCPSSPGSLRKCDGLLVSPPHIFDASMSNLKTLRIVASALPWDDHGYFGRVECLEIRSVPRVAWPTPAALISALVASPRLFELVLWGGGVAVVPDQTIPAFEMRALQLIKFIYSRETQSFLDVLRFGTYPRMMDMECHGFNELAWSAALHLPFLSNLNRLTICGRVVDVEHILPLLSSLTRLTILDLGETQEDYFEAIDVDLFRLASYVEMRQAEPMFKLESVFYLHCLTFPLTFFEFELLSDMRGRLASFTTSPEFDITTANRTYTNIFDSEE